MTRWTAFIEADGGITVDLDTDDPEEAEEIIERRVSTGHLGPANVRGIEKEAFAGDNDE